MFLSSKIAFFDRCLHLTQSTCNTLLRFWIEMKNTSVKERTVLLLILIQIHCTRNDNLPSRVIRMDKITYYQLVPVVLLSLQVRSKRWISKSWLRQSLIIPSGKTTNRMLLGSHYAVYQETLRNQRVLALQGKLVTIIILWHWCWNFANFLCWEYKYAGFFKYYYNHIENTTINFILPLTTLRILSM